MSRAIQHRGPDTDGVWCSAESGIALAHRRLSILDLSQEGHQPMVSHDGAFIIAFNGEIYNYREMRKTLASTGVNTWRGSSDTEVLLEAIAQKGIEDTIKMANGMFAFAVWDSSNRQLTLARDRAGQKPLYFGWLEGGGVLFGSELKCFWQHPRFKKQINRQSLKNYMRFGYVPDPQCIYENIYKLRPGCTVTLGHDAVLRVPSSAHIDHLMKRYWSVAEVASKGQKDMFSGNDSTAVTKLEELLGQAVGRRMISDVPLGAFLSGGVDSSLVVALMKQHSPNKIKTFTIGYDDKHYNEAVHARAVAKHLETDHTELILSPSDALDVIPKIPTMFDEPFADSSQIPTFLVSQLARQSVTVALSGDGGDEVFGGYNRHLQAPALWSKLKRLPRSVRFAIAAGLNSLSPSAWDRIYHFGPWKKRHALLGDKIQKIAKLLPSKDASLLYRSLCSQWQNPEKVVLGVESDFIIDNFNQNIGSDTTLYAQWLKLRDFQTYLAGDILVKVDRASMAVGLETRSPLLDHQLVEWAWSLPIEMNIRHGVGKSLLRQVLYKHVPQRLIDRPKMGFGVPIVHWLRKELKDWAAALLDEKRLKHEGYFDPKPIVDLWKQHQSGARNVQHQLWTVLMFQSWLETQNTAPF